MKLFSSLRSRILLLLMGVVLPIFCLINSYEIAIASTKDAQQQGSRKFVIASSDNFPPVNMLDNDGNLTGFGRDLSNTVIKAIGGQTDYIHSPQWTEVLEYLNSGKADFIHDTGYSKERDVFLDFSDPILEMKEVIIVRSEQYNITGFESLKEKTVACVDKHITHLYLMQFPEIRCHIVKTPAEGLYSLIAGDVDAFVYPEQIITYLSQELRFGGKIKVTGDPLRTLKWSMTVREGDKELLSLLNEGIRKVRQSGEYERIYTKWFGKKIFAGYSQKEVWFFGSAAILLSLVFGISLGLFILNIRLRSSRDKLIKTITEQKKAEEMLHVSESKYRTLHESMRDAFVSVDMQGWIKGFNQAYIEMLGYTENEIRNLRYVDLTPAKWHEFETKIVEEQILPRGFSDVYEKEYRRKDGTVFPVELRTFLIRDESGNPSAMWAIVRDITDRKKAENELQKRERLLSESQRIAHIGNWGWDLIKGPIEWTEEAYRVYGVSPETFTPTIDSLVGLLYQDDRPAMQRWIQECMEGKKPRELEFRIVLKDGTIRHLSGRGEVMYDADNKPAYMAGTVQDITDRKKAEEKLKITNEELSAINRIISTTTTTTTTTTTGVREILEKVMDEALNITGLEGGTICMVTPDETLHLAVQRETSEATILDLTTNEVKIGECLCGECARDHKPLILRDREAVLKFATREATRGEDIRFHAAYPLIIGERCLGVLCVFTRSDKKPSDRSLKLLETVTSQIAIAVDNAQMFEKISQHAATLENKVIERTTDLHASQKALTALVEDLDEKSKELQKSNEKLKEVDRLKSMFIASMSHELRTPLNSVIGFSSVLLNQWAGPVNDEQKSLLATISRSGKHLLSLINDVIDVSKIEAGRIEIYPENFDLYDLINEAVGLIKKDAAEKNLELKVDAIHLTMHTDRRRLLQNVLNLLSNAVKFTIEGHVKIEVKKIRSSEDEKHILTSQLLNFSSSSPEASQLHNFSTSSDFIEISVEDTGIGIKEEDIPKLFHSFVRLDSPLRTTVLGTGLGLYLTKKIVAEILKGDMIIESEYGKGSRFTIRIPIKI